MLTRDAAGPVDDFDRFGKLWGEQGQDTSKLGHIKDGFSRVVGKGGLRRLVTEWAMNRKSKKGQMIPYYYSNRVRVVERI